MSDPAWIVGGGVLFLLVLLPVISFNRFVRQRNLIRDSWSNIDTELRRRYDLIPNIVETVKGYAAHERDLLERVTSARAAAVAAQGPPADQARAEQGLVGTLRQLLAVVEGYPDLKASASFLALQEELAITEDRIQAARRFFNNNVRDYNIRIESFPSSIIASLFSFRREDFYEVDEAVRRAPSVGLSG